MLELLCKKYGVTLEELTVAEDCWHVFTAKDQREALLLRQCAIFVRGSNQIKNRTTGKRHYFFITRSQGIDLKECFQHYRKALGQHLEDATSAFIVKNRIFGPDRPGDANQELSESEQARAKRISALMAFMTSDRWQKPALRLPQR